MKIFRPYLFIFVFFSILKIGSGQTVSNLPENDQCIACHQDNDMMPDGFNPNDVHIQAGLSCSGCHGGNPNIDDEDAMSEKEGFIGVPDKKDIPQFCGKCHSDIKKMREFQPRIPTDQVSQYFTSIHGQKLKQGDQKVADCTSCHTSHAILSSNDPLSSVYPLNVPYTCKKCHSDSAYMKEYGIKTNQFDEYAQSVHGIDLLKNKDIGAPACNDCHGNHGAIPPGVESISHVCGTCHVNNMEYFSKTKMAQKFEEKKIHGCEECHGNHKILKTSDKKVGTFKESFCMKCHKSGDKGYETAGAIHKLLTRLSTGIDSAKVKQKEVQAIGMDDLEISYLLRDANQNLIQARTLVHTFDSTQVAEETNKGMANIKNADVMAIEQINENRTRRYGFGIATIFITILVIALYFKIKDMEKA